MSGMHAAHASSILRFAGRERALAELDDIDQLVQQHRARLLRFVAFSIGDLDIAESIVQDCFLKAYNARENFRGECSVQTWLNRIAMNLILDHQRTRKFRFWRSVRKTALDIAEIAPILSSGANTPEKDLLVRERVAQVLKALEAVSLNQRAIFLMHFQEEMGLREISLATDMSINTVKTHLHRAMKAVREKIGEVK
ncbi:MAG TPA: RNA polymerase sigma factor [Acidobacteriaceae bacterium]|nr:RNA polymerase sigma factor [Acidobacteriaceae bacterium]